MRHGLSARLRQLSGRRTKYLRGCDQLRKNDESLSSNSKEQFANSPDLTDEILTAVMDSMDAQAELSTRALNSEQIREGLKLILLDRLGLYEKLRTRASSG